MFILYVALFLKRFKGFGREILKPVESWSGGDNFEQADAGGPQQWPCFHPWVMRPNV